MKQKIRIFSLFLVLVMMVTSVLPVLAETKPLIISEMGYSHLENGKDAELDFKAVNTTMNEQKAHLVTALYDKQSNEMMYYNYVVETIPAKGEKLWGACIPIPEVGDYRVKVFAWEDMQSLKLVSNVLEVGTEKVPELDYARVLKETSTYLASKTPQALQVIGGEWSVLGLARASYPVTDNYYGDYYQKVVDVVQREIIADRPFGYKITEVQRLAIALTAMGKDATNVAGVDLVDYTWNKAKYFPTLSQTQQELGGRQGLNELVFGLITVDLQKSEQPEDATITREQIIDKMLKEYRTTDGGFSLAKGEKVASVDITAMALQALAPYYDSHDQVKKAVDEALTLLSKMQSSTGGFGGGEFDNNKETSESIAQVVVALTALGIDPMEDTRFIKGQNNPITNLLNYYAGNGQFKHTLDTAANMMATEQCHYALVAYDRLINNSNTLYDMTDVKVQQPEKVTVTLEIDRSSIATEEVLRESGYTATLAGPLQVEVEVGSKVVDVLEGAAKNHQFSLQLDNGKSYVEGMDNIVHAVDVEAFDLLCESFGLENAPSIFEYAGWMYTINEEFGQGINQDTVKEGDYIDFRYSLYYGAGTNNQWINYDWEFMDAYQDLQKLIASVNESSYVGDELAALKEAVKSAKDVLKEIETESQGMWIRYIGQKQTSLWGPSSPTENLEKAHEALQRAIDRVAEPKSITVNPSGFITLTMGEAVQLEAKILPANAPQEVKYEVVTGSEYVKVSETGVITPLVVGNNLSMIKVSSKEKPEVTTNIFVNEILPSAEVPDESAVQITEEELNANTYETYYWVKGKNYQVDNKDVTFIDSQTIQYGGQTKLFKNKCINYTIQAGEDNIIQPGEEITILFDGGISVPIGQVPGLWNSTYAGVIQTVYETDIPSLTEVRSENKPAKLNEIKFIVPLEASGSYTLTEGSVYEKANEWSPGIEGIGKEGFFGTLPDIQIEVGESTLPRPIGSVELAIEKRTIGKGDTLSLEVVDLFKGDTVWDVIKREAQARNIDVKYSENSQYGSIYISSIDGDGEFDYGNGSGWQYSVNGEFVDKGVSAYDLVDEDVIRLRYCVSVSGNEFTKPLVELLKNYIETAKEYKDADYTEESYRILQMAIVEAEKIANNPEYDSMETSKEFKVSEQIGQIIAAIKGLKRGDNPLPPSEVPDDFANDIGLNKDFLELQVGENYQIVARRLDEIIDNPISNQITHPTYHYEVVQGNSVEVDEKGKVTALEQGTSVIAVTYDAVQANNKTYGAISPINTGLFVVSVTDGIDTGIEINFTSQAGGLVNKARSYDTYYFTEDTIDYSFAIDAINSDEVVVKVNEDIINPQGSIYTAKLRNSGNIIEVIASNEIGSTTFAKVIDARKVEIITENVTDATRNDDIRVGDQVRVSFRGITPPVYKLATIYNPSFPNVEGTKGGTKVAYTCEELGGFVVGKTTQWDLATKNAIEFVATTEGTYSFTDGHIDQGWWGSPLGTEKGMAEPGEPNLNASHHHSKFSQLPDFMVKVGKAVVIPATGVEINKDVPAIELGQSYQLEAKVLPKNATEKAILFTSSDEAIAKVDSKGKITPVAVGEVKIIAQLQGTDLTDEVDIEIIPELPATEDEKLTLRLLIEEVKGMEQGLYTDKSWLAMQEVLARAEAVYSNPQVLLEEVKKIQEELDHAVSGLEKDFSVGIDIISGTITPGSEVTIYLSNLTKPQYDVYPMNRKMHTVYQTDIDGIEEITTSNGIDNEEVLKTLKFTIPKTTTPGAYTLSGGRIEASSKLPQINDVDHRVFYQDKMPEIKITVVSAVDIEAPSITTPQAVSIGSVNISSLLEKEIMSIKPISYKLYPSRQVGMKQYILTPFQQRYTIRK